MSFRAKLRKLPRRSGDRLSPVGSCTRMYLIPTISRDCARWPQRTDRNEIILGLLSAISRIQSGRFCTAVETSLKGQFY